MAEAPNAACELTVVYTLNRVIQSHAMSSRDCDTREDMASKLINYSASDAVSVVETYTADGKAAVVYRNLFLPRR